MKTTTANYTADTDRFALPGNLFDVAAHMDWDGQLQAGEIIEARWTCSHRHHRAIAKVVRVNRKSVRVELLTAPDGYEVGRTFSVPRNVFDWSGTTWSQNNGAFPARLIASEITESNQDVTSAWRQWQDENADEAHEITREFSNRAIDRSIYHAAVWLSKEISQRISVPSADVLTDLDAGSR